MSALTALLNEGRQMPAHRPVPRAVVRTETWMVAIALLAAGDLTLLGVWATLGRSTWRCCRRTTAGSRC